MEEPRTTQGPIGPAQSEMEEGRVGNDITEIHGDLYKGFAFSSEWAAIAGLE